jgi:large subunit ribosomal protein L4
MKTDLYDSTGKKKASIDINAIIFGAKINEDLMHRSVVMRRANARNPIAHTLTRAEVSATTAKAFRQKGTGRARRGAKSTNLLRGGGVTHGPRNTRNFSKDMPRKERRLALFSSLSVKAKNNDVLALESLNISEPKTKTFIELLKNLPPAKKYLFVLPERMEVFEKSASNVPHVKTILASYLNPYDVLNADKICFVDTSLQTLEDTFLTTDKK